MITAVEVSSPEFSIDARMIIGNYGKPTYERLLEWIELWSRVAKQPGELLFGRSLPNILEAARSQLEQRQPQKDISRDGGSGLSELLGLLEGALVSSDPTVALLARDYPAEIAELRALLAAGPVPPARLRPLLGVLARGPSVGTLREALQEALVEPPRRDDALLYVASSLLLRPFATKHSESFLESIPQRSLAQAMLEHRVLPALPTLRASKGAQEAVKAVAADIIDADRTRSYFEAVPRADGLFGLFSEHRWTHGVYEFLRGAYAACAAVVAQASYRDAAGCDIALREVGQDLLRIYLRSVVEHALRHVHEAVFYWPIPQAVHAGEEIGSLLARASGLSNQRGADEHREPLNRMCGDAVAEAVLQLTAHAAADSILAGDWSATADEIAAEIAGALRNTTSSDIGRRCLADRAVQDRLGRLLLPVAHAALALMEHGGPSFDDLRADSDEFWSAWIGHASRRTNLTSEIIHYCPWDAMPAAVVARAVATAAVNQCSPPTDEWLVISDLKGLEAEGETWQVGEVIFFDPSMHDFGEGAFFGRNPEHREGTATVCTVIAADSPQLAARGARQRFETALDACSYAVVHKEDEHGIRAEFLAPEKLINLSRESWSGSWKDDLSERPRHVRHAGRSRIPALAEHYRPLFALSARDSNSLGAAEERLLRALRAYREGYWRRPPERYLRYWTGLEQMFAQGERTTKLLFDRVPQIHVTWRDIQGLSLSPTWRSAIFQGISAQYPEFRRDEPDEWPARVVLTLEEDAWRTQTTRSDDAQAIFRRHADQPPTVDPPPGRPREFDTAVRAELDFRRARCRFLLYRLYDLRNLIVHEALPYRVDLELYCDALEHVFEDVLRKTVDVYLNPARGGIEFNGFKAAVQGSWERGAQ